MSNSQLFENKEVKHNAILVVDASGSVIGNNYGHNTNKLVFDRMLEVAKNLKGSGENGDEFRLLFWNSSRCRKSFFKEGAFVIPYLVKKGTLSQPFNMVKNKIDNSCLTESHIGFTSIPNNWINDVDTTKIYFITDGQMGWGGINNNDLRGLKNQLRDSIKNTFKKHNNIQLNIITVEAVNRNFNTIETLNNAAGCDVYNVIMDNQMTGYVTKFISYTPNNDNGFVHLNKVIAPPGFVPFENKYFSELRVGEFIQYIVQLINDTATEDDQLKIVQNLSVTLSALTKDKPKQIVNGIIETFCHLFKGSLLDPLFVNLILTTEIKNETEGSANVFASYRQQLRNLYKQANSLLNQSVKQAVGMQSKFVTLPMENQMISGHTNMVDQTLEINRNVYPYSSVEISGHLLPALPLDLTNKGTKMNEQCLRQWVRAILSIKHKVNVRDDKLIFLTLGYTLQVVCSDVDVEVKNFYRYLGKVMLLKKRLNTDMTELEKIENGELPLPNSGRATELINNLNFVRTSFDFKKDMNPLTLWYIMCKALGNETLVTKQLIHCKESILEDFPDFDENSNLLTRMSEYVDHVSYHKISSTHMLDYNCLITLENVSEIGGYKFKPHIMVTGSVCSPFCVLSKEGYNQLVDNPHTAFCPICYTQLSSDNFEWVDKKEQMEELNIFTDSFEDIYFKQGNIPKNKSVTKPVQKSSGSYNNSQLNKKGFLIIMKGVVGAGKSTASKTIKEKVEELGGYCVVEGVDKYSKNGMNFNQAQSEIKKGILSVNDTDAELVVVVIDTCGERDRKNEMTCFGVNFNGWTKVNFWPNYIQQNKDGYLAWSLRNVLQRTAVSSESDYYLNPVGAGVGTCIQVHQKKERSLGFSKKTRVFQGAQPFTSEDAINKLKEKADEYEQSLNSVEETVGEFLEKNVLCYSQ